MTINFEDISRIEIEDPPDDRGEESELFTTWVTRLAEAIQGNDERQLLEVLGEIKGWMVEDTNAREETEAPASS